jgi:hypothetical protein
MTSNTDLEELLKNLKITNFQGCYFKDELNELKPNSSYIINLQSEFNDKGNRNNGTHWVALVTDNRSNAIYFDSFGSPPPTSIIKLLKKYKYKYGYTNKVIQNIRSDLCGYFAVAFIYFLTKHPSRTTNINKNTNIFINVFEDLNKVQSVKNEYILALFFKKRNKTILFNKNNTISRDNHLDNDFKIENSILTI